MIGQQLSRAHQPMIKQLIGHVEEHGLDTVGIFRVSATSSSVQRLEDCYKASGGKEIDPVRITSPLAAATFLKQFCLSLPEPLIPHDLYAPLVAVMGMSEEEKMVDMYRSLLKTLPCFNREVLVLLCQLMEKIVENSNVNKMTASSLGLVVGPGILRPLDADDRQLQKSRPAIAAVVCDLVEHYQEYFDRPHEAPTYSLVSRAMYDFPGGDESHEHGFAKDDMVFLLPAADDSGWREGTLACHTSVSGTFPGNYLVVVLDIQSLHEQVYGLHSWSVGIEDMEATVNKLQEDLKQEQRNRIEMEKLVKLLSAQYIELKMKSE